MFHSHRGFLALGALLSLTALGASNAVADVLCKRKSGALRLRPVCKVNEQALPIAIEEDGKLVVFEGANVQIVDGSGDTDGPTNGLGNLILGYDENSSIHDEVGPNEVRTGSHNLVIGDEHTYSSYGGIVAGLNNKVTARYASVTGGEENEATGELSSVTGGRKNEATATHASVTGGALNRAMASSASVSGGVDNLARGPGASASGGTNAKADGGLSWVGGGEDNSATGYASTVSGGTFNRAEGSTSSVSGGSSRTAASDSDWVAGSLSEDD